MPLIELKKITKEFHTDEVVTPVLRGVDLVIEAGEFISIRGPSGSGKSTLLHIIGLLDRLSSGEYFFDGREVGKLNDLELAAVRNEKIGFVFQSFYLLPRTSLLENVILPTIYAKKKTSVAATKARALELLELVGLSHRINSFSNQISGGETQRAAIARALMMNPTLICADEPTGNLDQHNAEAIMQIFEKLHAGGKTIVMVTHEPELAERASRQIFVRDGLLVDRL